MKNFLLLLSILFFLAACGEDDLSTCISHCSSSVPGKVNLAVENHSNLAISNLQLTINDQSKNFALFPKERQGSFSCWQSFEEIISISNIQFIIGQDSTFNETLKYKNLNIEREYSIDIRNVENELRIQLIQNPPCVSDAD